MAGEEGEVPLRAAPRKQASRRLLGSLQAPVLFFAHLWLLSCMPKLLNGPGMWENLILSDWVPPHPQYPHLLNSFVYGGPREHEGLWQQPDDAGWRPCSTPTKSYLPPRKSKGYLQVWLEGGLNQQRIGVCNAVALARLLNVTLLLPELELNPVWQDTSTLGELFDVDFLINSLKGDVTIVKELPADMQWSTREFYRLPATGEHLHQHTRVKNAPAHATAEWYIENVLPIILRHGIAAIAPFTHRLAFDGLPPDIQKLRCRVNFELLRFVPHIEALGQTLLKRLQSPDLQLLGLPPNHPLQQLAAESQPVIGIEAQAQPEPAKFLALHLRFDKDMVAHSSCDFGGGLAERRTMMKYRSFAWQNRIDKLQHTPEELRRMGKCPLTPEEIGLMLAALGFSDRTRLYLASYKVYGGEARMRPLQNLFPLLMDKTQLASREELAPFIGRASHLAALDFLVALHSDVFVSASPGNMRNVLAGFRQYKGVMKTINPALIKLADAFQHNSENWKNFTKVVLSAHKKRSGQIAKRGPTQSIYTYPAPDCMCQKRR